jgi:penicillin-binding protein 2
VNVAIGQGDVNVTPMQQLVFYGALASGVVWRPQVVKRIEDPNGNVLKEFAPEERGRLNVKKSTRETVLKGLFAAVNEKYGTGYWQRVKEFNVAGKTGTAQVVKLGARRLKAEQITYFHRDHAWFAAFAPAEDPEIVVVVLNEHSGFGSSNAAPTAMALMREYMRLKAEDAAGGAPVAVAGAVPSAAAPPPPAAAPPPPTPKSIAPSVKPPAAAVTATPVPAKADAAVKPIAVPPARRPAVPVPAVAGPSPAAPASAPVEQALPRVKAPAVPAPVPAPARADEPAEPSPPKPPELRIPDALPLPSNEAAPPGAPETPAAGRRAVRGGARGA